MKKICGLLFGLALVFSVGCQPPAEPPTNDSNTTSIDVPQADTLAVV